METRFGINKKYWRKNQHQGAHTLSTRMQGAPRLMGPMGLHQPQPQPHIFTFGEEKLEERIHRVL